MAMKGKNKPPSGIRYEQENPTVSFRTDRNTYNRLQHIRDSQGISYGDVMRTGLDILEPKIITAEESWDKGFENGFQKGWDNAEITCTVAYRCHVCG
ncbi:hypothetical protein ACFLTZ_00695 [Chloroflexota bacterium]